MRCFTNFETLHEMIILNSPIYSLLGDFVDGCLLRLGPYLRVEGMYQAGHALYYPERSDESDSANT